MSQRWSDGTSILPIRGTIPVRRVLTFLRKSLFDPERSLRRDFVSSGLTVGTLRFLNRFMRFVRLIIVARLLNPAQIGLFGMTVVIYSGIHRFTRLGLRQALINRQDSDDQAYHTAWTARIFRGLILYLFLILAASPLATFFEQPRLLTLMVVFGLSFPITSAHNMQIIALKKHLKYLKVFPYEFSITLSNVVISIVLVWWTRDVMGLIAAIPMGHVTGLVVSYVLYNNRSKLVFHWSVFKELFTYGKWIFVSATIYFLITEADDLIVAKMLTAGALGLYTIAYRFSNAPVQVLVKTLNRILFPAFSRVQTRRETVRSTLTVTVRLLGLTLFPVLLFLATNARLILGVLFDREWLEAAPVLILLSIFALFHGMYLIFTSVFRGIDQPNRETICNVVYIGVFLPLTIPLIYRYELLGMPLALLVSILVTFLLGMRFVRSSVRYGYRSLLRDLGPVLLACATFPAVRGFLDRIGLVPGQTLTYLLLTLVLSAGTYLAVIALFEFRFHYGLRRNLDDLLDL